MHHVVFLKERENTEDTRLVQVEHFVLQVLEAHGAVETHQGAIDQDTIYRRFDRLVLQMLDDGLCIHCSCSFFTPLMPIKTLFDLMLC